MSSLHMRAQTCACISAKTSVQEVSLPSFKLVLVDESEGGLLLFRKLENTGREWETGGHIYSFTPSPLTR